MNTGKWFPAPDIKGAGAARLGYACKADHSLWFALPSTWDSSLNYTFPIRFRAWPKEGKPDDCKWGLLSMMVGTGESEPDWVAVQSHIIVETKEWGSVTLPIAGSISMLLRVKDRITSPEERKMPWGEGAHWIDSIEVLALPAIKSGKKG